MHFYSFTRFFFLMFIFTIICLLLLLLLLLCLCCCVVRHVGNCTNVYTVRSTSCLLNPRGFHYSALHIIHAQLNVATHATHRTKDGRTGGRTDQPFLRIWEKSPTRQRRGWWLAIVTHWRLYRPKSIVTFIISIVVCLVVMQVARIDLQNPLAPSARLFCNLHRPRPHLQTGPLRRW